MEEQVPERGSFNGHPLHAVGNELERDVVMKTLEAVGVHASRHRI
jgi:hypothetical protein